MRNPEWMLEMNICSFNYRCLGDFQWKDCRIPRHSCHIPLYIYTYVNIHIYIYISCLDDLKLEGPPCSAVVSVVDLRYWPVKKLVPSFQPLKLTEEPWTRPVMLHGNLRSKNLGKQREQRKKSGWTKTEVMSLNVGIFVFYWAELRNFLKSWGSWALFRQIFFKMECV